MPRWAEAGLARRESLRIATDVHETPVALEALASFASLQAEQDDREHAIELLLLILNHPASLQETKDRAHHLRAELETHAQKYYKDCLSWAREKGLPTATSYAKLRLADLFLRRGEGAKAFPFFHEALQYFQKSGSRIGVIFTLEGLAGMAVMQDKYDKAVWLFAWADARREKLDDHRSPVEQASVERDLAFIRSKLRDSDFAKLSTEAQAMTVKRP